MRNSLVTAAVLFSLATASMADDQKKDGEAQTRKAEQTQMARNDADRSRNYASSVKNCLSESGEALPGRWPGAEALRTGRPQRPRLR